MHAYLIIAYNDFELLKCLIRMLDYPYNDIYIHIDKKSKKFKQNDFIGITKYSKLYFIKREKVYWGGYSQVNCEINLLKSAKNRKSYSYYHLLSGADLPIKSIEEIYNFFENNLGKEFISFDVENEKNGEFLDRIKYYYPLQDIIGRRNKFLLKYSFCLSNYKKN